MNTRVASRSHVPVDLAPVLRLASVSFVNARPLIHGLDQHPAVRLTLDVPANLLDGLRDARFDVALLPVIDYQRLDGLVLLPAGGIGSDGATLTVRIFSRVPIDRIGTLACDPDSHTSVALARIILQRAYGIRPEFVALSHASASRADAQLLIGDKVICDAPVGFEHQLDLGQAWKDLTGMPFVFAAWMGRPDSITPEVDRLLRHAKGSGLASIESIVARYAIPRGWPADVARDYLTRYLQFDIDQPQLRAIEAFHRMAADEGIIPSPPRPLALAAMTSSAATT